MRFEFQLPGTMPKWHRRTEWMRKPLTLALGSRHFNWPCLFIMRKFTLPPLLLPVLRKIYIPAFLQLWVQSQSDMDKTNWQSPNPMPEPQHELINPHFFFQLSPFQLNVLLFASEIILSNALKVFQENQGQWRNWIKGLKSLKTLSADQKNGSSIQSFRWSPERN